MWKRFTECFSCTRPANLGHERLRINGDGTSEKLSSEDNDKYLPAQLVESEVKEEDGSISETSEDSEQLRSQPPEKEVDLKEQEESVSEGGLRRRVSGREESRGHDKPKAKLSSRDERVAASGADFSRQQPSEREESAEVVSETAEIVSKETVLESEKGKGAGCPERQTFDNINNSGTSDSSGVSSSSKQHDTSDKLDEFQTKETTKAPEVVPREAVDKNDKEEYDIGEEEGSINNHDNENVTDSEQLKEPNSNTGEEIVVEEMVRRDIDELVLYEPAVEVGNEKDCSVENEPVINHNTSSVTKSNANEASTFVFVERFSEKLSKSVCNAVLHQPHIFKRQDDHVENSSEDAISKFASNLADLIVKTVLDFSRKMHVNETEVADNNENCDLAPNAEYDHICKTGERVHGDIEPMDESVYSAEETVDDALYKSVNDYATVLSEEIISCVYELKRAKKKPTNCSLATSTEVYIKRLTDSVLSDAFNTAACCMSKGRPDVKINKNSLDMYIDDMVDNILQSAISRVAVEDQMEHQNDKEHQGISWNQNGCIGDGDLYYNDEGLKKVENNGKLQTKWLSEDDLDDLYEDNSSDEEDVKVGNISANCRNVDNLTDKDDSKSKDAANNLRVGTDSLQKEQTAFWRKSLIQDLEDELDFEDFESPPSSSPSNLSKSANCPTNESLTDGSSGDEDMFESTQSAKAPASLFALSNVAQSSSGRSRLRSVDSSPVLVFDNGSGFLKVGFSDQDMPKEIVPSVVGMPLRYSQDISGMEYSYRPGLVFGSEAIWKAGVLHIDYPLKGDVVDKWNDVEGLWNYVLSSVMGIQDNPDFPVLITQPGLNSKKNTEKLAELLFERFHVPSLFVANQPVLSLFSMGYTSGLSFCSGFSSTQASVVYEGHILPHTVKQLDVAGYQLTETLRKLLMSGQGFGFRSSSQWQIVNDIKEKMASVSTDFEGDAKRYRTQAELQTPYELPDGQVIEVGLERFGCAEALFRPMELGLTQPPAHMLIKEAVNSCEEELQELCYKWMGLSGGTTLLPGFVTRLERELRDCDRKFRNFTVPEHRDLSTWLGGSVMASLPTFREMVVTVDEYAEAGARVVHSKCF